MNWATTCDSVPFPERRGLGFIAMAAAGKYGVIQPVICSPLRLGRNFDEWYRALVALQTADAFSVATQAVLDRILKK